uniref:Uncharacterized protein n=1 Tax=Anguilla anguilla TaxID=7936 RepID=A0A0E9WB28_ANGAN
MPAHHLGQLLHCMDLVLRHLREEKVLQLLFLVGQGNDTSIPVHHPYLLNTDVQLQLDRFADLLITLRGNQHLDTRLVHIIDVGPMSLDLRILYATGQAIDCPCSPASEKDVLGLFDNLLQQPLTLLQGGNFSFVVSHGSS